MSKIESAVSWMWSKAKDNRHGYDQRYRWGEKGDYDCSSAVITAWEQAGVLVKTNGATYTGNMYDAFYFCGFKDVTASVNLSTGAGLRRGDVLLNKRKHTAMFCGNGLEVEASINENGGITGGIPGDQTGREFLIKSYRNYPWDCVLRYAGETVSDSNTGFVHNNTTGGKVIVTANILILKKGMAGTAVTVWQNILCAAGCAVELDGSFGPVTEDATRQFELSRGITDDPHEVGPAAWKAGLELLGAAKTF